MLLFRSFVAKLLQSLRLRLFRMKGYIIGNATIIESLVFLDKVYSAGVRIGKECLIEAGVTISSHDYCKCVGPNNVDCWKTDTVIGNRCIVAVNALIMSGVHIGDECVIGVGAVVTPPLICRRQSSLYNSYGYKDV